MAMSTDKPKRIRPRGNQRYPFISLPKALDRTRELYRVADTYEVPVAAALKAWGYAEQSSGGMMTIAALKMFGLVADSGSGKARKVKLTDAALKIIRDPRTDSTDRNELIRACALTPPIHENVLQKFQGVPRSAEALRAYLLMDLELREDAATDFYNEFFDTMAYAGLGESDIIQSMEQNKTQDTKEMKPHTPQPTYRPPAVERPTQGLGQVSLTPSGENDIKVLLDGNHIRVAAMVNREGLKKLIKILNTHEAFLETENAPGNEISGTKTD